MNNPIIAAAYVTVLADGEWIDAPTVASMVQQTLTDADNGALDDYADDRAVATAIRGARTWLIREKFMEFDPTTGEVRIPDPETTSDAITDLIHAAEQAPTEVSEPLPSGKTRFDDITVNGHREEDIWAYAPTAVLDRVHAEIANPDTSVPAIMAMLPMTTFTRTWSDSRSRIWVPAGRGAEVRDLIATWASTTGTTVKDLRVEENVPFRNVAAIPADLLGGIVHAAVAKVISTPRGDRAVKSILALEDGRFSDREDVASALTLYAYDLTDRFDDTRGAVGRTNFTAYLYGRVSNWAYDVARSRYGRESLEVRNQIAKASDQLLAQGIDPSQARVSAHIDGGSGTFAARYASLKALWNLRDAGSIWSVEDGEQIVDVPTPSDANDVFDYATANDLSRAVAGSCVTYTDGKVRTDAVALISAYQSTWGGRTYNEISDTLGMRDRTVSAAVRRVTTKAAQNPVLLDMA